MAASSIEKSSGEQEPFSEKKLRRSITRAGGSSDVAKEIVQNTKKQKFDSTEKIHQYVFRELRRQNRPLAARYNLKQAIFELGPTGFPFEKFVAELFRARGYKVRTGQIIQGYCVRHEIDVVAYRGNQHDLVEVKFHKRRGIKSDVKVALYVKSRFDDVNRIRKDQKGHKTKFHQAWLVTNTQLTRDAIRFAECVGMKAIGWSYPRDNSLARMIDKLGVHPVTALTRLSKKQKAQLAHHGVILCRQIKPNQRLLRAVGVSSGAISRIVDEAEAICSLD